MDTKNTTQKLGGKDPTNQTPPTPDDDGSKDGSGQEGTGGKFVPITTQEDFEKAFAWRWAREKAKYDNFDTYKAAYARLASVEADLESERTRANEAYEKLDELEQTQRAEELRVEIAAQEGIKPSLIPLLTGTSKEEIEESAKVIKAAIGDETAPIISSDGCKGGTLSDEHDNARYQIVVNFVTT
jgi:hypothetical protein